MAIFDSLIGNTDRHQENWGVVFNQNNESKLSPLFDNGTSLGHERFIKHVQNWDNKRLASYINRGYHHLRYNRENTENRIKHFELVKLLAQKQMLKKHMCSIVSNIELDEMLEEISHLTTIKCEVPFSRARFNWISSIIKLRLDLIKEELK